MVNSIENPDRANTAALQGILQDQCDLLRALEATLATETEILSGATPGGPERLMAIAAEKQVHLGSLAASGMELDRVLRDTGCPADREGLERYLASIDADATAALSALRTELKNHLENCRAVNQANGSLIERRHESVQQALWLLNGEDSATGTYAPSGRVGPAPRSHTLAKA